MLEQKLLKLCIDNEFYVSNKAKIKDTFFTGPNKLVYDAITDWHNKFERTCSLDELQTYLTIKYPVLNQAMKSSLQGIVTSLADTELIGSDIGKEVINELYKADKAREIGELAAGIISGSSTSFTSIRNICDSFDDNKQDEHQFNAVSSDIEAVLAGVETNVHWRFNINSLSQRVAGIGPGIFTLVFARPEMGKTAFLVSLASGPGGFADQGAVVHYFQNEEPAIRSMARSITAYCGENLEWVKTNIQTANDTFNKIRGRVKLFDCVGTSIEELDDHVRQNKPDILIIDQLDKIRVMGEFAREDMRIRELYIQTRELAKRHNIAVIGASQCSADGEGHAVLNFSWCENSKTGKAAECDLIIGVGRNPNFDDNIRHLTLCKNKISGNHDNWSVILEKEKSLYRD